MWRLIASHTKIIDLYRICLYFVLVCNHEPFCFSKFLFPFSNLNQGSGTWGRRVDLPRFKGDNFLNRSKHPPLTSIQREFQWRKCSCQFGQGSKRCYKIALKHLSDFLKTFIILCILAFLCIQFHIIESIESGKGRLESFRRLDVKCNGHCEKNYFLSLFSLLSFFTLILFLISQLCVF